MADWQEVEYDLEIGAISKDSEWPLTQISIVHHYSMLDISKMIQDRHTVTTDH